MKNVVYISQLIEDDELVKLMKKEDNGFIGMEAIDFGIGYMLDYVETVVTQFKNRMEEIYPAHPLSIHGPFLDLNPGSFDLLVKKATLKRFEQSYQAAKMLHADRIVFHSGYIPAVHYAEGWPEQIAEFWKEFLQDKDDSIQIHMENNLDRDGHLFAKVFDLVKHPAFSACLDIGHVNCYSNQSLESWMNCLSGKIGHLHLHDNKGNRDSHLALGDGEISLHYLEELIGKYCPDVSVTIENSSVSDIEKSLYQVKQILNHINPL